MAQLDVSNLLLDPDFIDTLTLISRTATTDTYGVTQLVEVSASTVGSVQPASYKQIQRLPDALRSADIRSFFIKAEIKTNDPNYPAIILFQGNRYQIQTVAPWLNYGSGWNEGICVAEKPSL